MPTMWELVVLWILLCGFGWLFIPARFIIIVNVFILITIVAGFFIGIGIKLLTLMVGG